MDSKIKYLEQALDMALCFIESTRGCFIQRDFIDGNPNDVREVDLSHEIIQEIKLLRKKAKECGPKSDS